MPHPPDPPPEKTESATYGSMKDDGPIDGHVISLHGDDGGRLYPIDVESADSSARIKELLLTLTSEFEHLEHIHQATAKENGFLKEVMRSGMPVPGESMDIPMENHPSLELAMPTSPTQRHPVQPSFGEAMQHSRYPSYSVLAPRSPSSSGEVAVDMPGPISAPRGPSASSIASADYRVGIGFTSEVGFPSEEPKGGAFFSADSQFCSEVSKFESEDGGGPSANQKRRKFARKLTSASSHSLMGTANHKVITRKLAQLGRRFTHPGAAQFPSESPSDSPDSHPNMSWAIKIHKSVWFEPALATAIMINAFIMCAELQYTGIEVGYEMQFRGSETAAFDAWPHAVGVFEVVEWIFGTFFAFELLFRLRCLKRIFFKDIWNWIDVLIVLCFVIDRMVILPVGTQWVRVCRFARLGRLLTLARTVQGFDHLFLITTAIRDSVGILAWALLLLFVIHMTVALVMGQFMHAVFFKNELGESDASIKAQHDVYKYFGTWTRSMLSTFEITLGNWPPICRLLVEEVSEWCALVVLIHKLTIGFAVVGVINGVFMKETFRVAETDDIIMVRQKLRQMQLHQKNMESLFQALDSTGNGRVTRQEFKKLALFPAVKTWLLAMELHTDDLDTMFQLIDVNGDGTITHDELVMGVGRLKGPARSIDMVTLQREHKGATEALQHKVQRVGGVAREMREMQRQQSPQSAFASGQSEVGAPLEPIHE